MKGFAGDGNLVLEGRGEVPDMLIKRPLGTKEEQITACIETGTRCEVWIKANMYHDESPDAWVVHKVFQR